jgi:hypothetical protein
MAHYRTFAGKNCFQRVKKILTEEIVLVKTAQLGFGLHIV